MITYYSMNNWDYFKNEFIKLGGIVSNLTCQEGSNGRGIFREGNNQKPQILCPPSLLTKVEEIVLVSGKFRLKEESDHSQEAREFIATLIKSRLAATSTKLLLVLGQSAENWLFSKQQRSACDQGLLPIDSEVTAIIAPSLEQMLKKPQLKRDTWQIICRYLNKNSPES